LFPSLREVLGTLRSSWSLGRFSDHHATADLAEPHGAIPGTATFGDGRRPPRCNLSILPFNNVISAMGRFSAEAFVLPLGGFSGVPFTVFFQVFFFALGCRRLGAAGLPRRPRTTLNYGPADVARQLPATPIHIPSPFSVCWKLREPPEIEPNFFFFLNFLPFSPGFI